MARVRRGIRVARRTFAELDSLGARSRSILANTAANDEAVDVLDILERVDGVVVTLPDASRTRAPIRVAPLSPGEMPARVAARARYVPDEGRIVIEFAHDTYDALRRHDASARFTAIHEIGHVKLHLDALYRLTQLPHDEVALERSRRSHPHIEDSEVQANRYAGSFMAPDIGLDRLFDRGALDADTVARTYGMSYFAAHYRILHYREACASRMRRAK